MYVSPVAHHDVASIRSAVRAALSRRARVVLAVSGGLDSMALLDAAAAVVRPDRLVVATFDHGTGSSASAAASLVEARAGALGLRAVRGRAERAGESESEWREARWSFLRSIADAESAEVCTAHTRDDQVETVLIRVMRDAGARGLAGLYAPSPIVRPLIDVRRTELHEYAHVRGLTWIEDPSNQSRRFLRNRLRLDVLPALRRIRPEFEEELLEIARGAAKWREDLDEASALAVPARVRAADSALDVAAQSLTTYSAQSLAVLWPALAAKVGLAVDRRGTERLVAFTHSARVGSRIQLSGGWGVFRSRQSFELRRTSETSPASTIEARGGRWGTWSFVPTATVDRGDSWAAWLPADAPIHVRAWRPGDVLAGDGNEGTGADSRGRKVKQLLSAAGVTGYARTTWPVVVSGDQIVWVPGVGRSDAATERSGRPALPFRCEYLDR